MNMTLRIFVMLISILIFSGVIYTLVKKNMNESHSILWLVIGFATLLSGCFPGIINWLSGILGIDYPPTLLFLMSTVILMIITFKNSMGISKMEAKLNEIAITVSILQEENQAAVTPQERDAVYMYAGGERAK